MAKIFSWALKKDEETIYAYLAGLKSGYCTKDKIVNSTKLKEIANEVSQYDWKKYERRFGEMVDEAVRDYGVSRSLFKDASFYYNVGGSIIMLSGADGVSNNAGLTCAIFRNEDKGKTLTVDDTPTFGNVYYDKTSKKLKGLEKGWTDNAESRSSNQVTWMSSAYFRDTENNGEQITNWCTPILITGEDGRDGSDGKNSEFIYALTKDDKEQPKYPTTDAGREALFNALAESSEPRDVDGTKWWDRAQAIDSENYLAEWVWTRFKKAGSDEWIYTERPVIWALWGSDGTDGDGIEYIFQRTHTTDERPTPLPKPIGDYFNPETWKKDYNRDEYIPDGWSDNPMGVDKDYQCEWVSTRKYTKQEKGKYDFYDYIENKDKMAWGEFSDPVIWSNYSKKGVSTYTAFIFTRTNDIKITTYHVHGGTYDDPLEGIETREADDITVVSGIKWYDSVPGGSAPVYMCRRVFSDEDTGEKNEWSQPVLMADNPNFQVEYSENYVKDGFGLPSLNQFIEKKNKYTIKIDASKGEQHAGTWVVSGKYNDEEGVNEEAWRNLCEKAGYGEWKDVNDDGLDAIEPVYMATARRVDNNWSDWVISKIKGEQGKKGESIQLKGSVVIEEDLKSDPDVDDRPSFANDTEHYNVNDLGCAFYDDDKDPKFYEYVQMWVFNTQKKWERLKGGIGDCYYTPEHGHLIKWKQNDEQEDKWEDAGLFKGEVGEPGTTYYLHTAFANEDPNGYYVILNDGTNVRITKVEDGAGKYFGIYTDTISGDEEDLSKKWHWARWNGEDGYGMEQIFQLGTAENVPFVPTEETPYDEEPLGWLDSPIEPTRDQIICYTCHRRYGKSKQWKGTEDGHALVYNRYVENGLSAAVLSISNDNLSTLVDENQKTLIDDEEISQIHFVYGTQEINPDTAVNFSCVPSGLAANYWDVKYSPEKKAIITKIARGKSFTGTTEDRQEVIYNDIQVDVNATITDGGIDRNIHGEAHIRIRAIQSDHLYEIATDRDTIHKDSYGSLIVGQKEIYLFLNKQYNNSGVGKIIPITQIPEERDWRIYYAIDNSERQEITNFTPTEYIKGVSTAITVFNTDIQEKPNNSIQIITEMVTNDGKHVITDTETIKVVNNGKDGQDASEIEYVYHIYPTGTKVTIEENLNQEHGRIHDPDNPEAFIETDDYKRNDDWMPSDKQGSFWTDHPVSVGVGQEEWCAIRYKKGGDEGWGKFEAPFIWSAYGISGRDGDGVEYVYFINNGEEPILNQNKGYYWDGSRFIWTDKRQREDFLPAAEENPKGTEVGPHWIDNPGSVTKNNPVQWVAKRKFRDATPEGGTKGWDYFSEPTVWNNYSETGVDVDFTNDKALIGTDEDTILDEETIAETDVFMKYGLDHCTDLNIIGLTYNGVKEKTVPTIGARDYTQIGTTEKVGLKLSEKTVDGVQYIHFNFKLSAGLDLTKPIYIGVNLGGVNEQELLVVGTNTFTIAGLKGGEEAVQYNIVVNPHGASVNSAGIFNVSELTITVNKTKGKTPPTPLTELTSTQKLYYTVGNSTSETLLTYGKTGAKLNISRITDGSVNFKFKINDIVVDEETIHIVRDGQGSLTADLDNENILIGTGSDTILGKDSTGHTTTLILRDGTGYCTELGLIGTHVSGKYSFDNVNIHKGNPQPIGKKDDGKDIEISMGYAQSGNTGLTFTMNLYFGLELATPYVFTFVVTGKTQSGISVQGFTTLTLGGLRNGKEALYYHLTTMPSGINISKDGSWSSKNINVKVQRIDGDVVTDVTSGEVSWGVNNESLTRKLSLSSTGATLTQNEITAVTLSPKTVTFSFTENGFIETETLYIVADGKDGLGVVKADFDNEVLNVGTGDNFILGANVTRQSKLTLQAGGYCTDVGLIGDIIIKRGDSTWEKEASQAEIEFDGISKSKLNITTGLTEITVKATLNNGLDLEIPYDFTFTVTGKTILNGVETPVTGSTVLSVVGVKGGAEGESYDIILNPSGIQTNSERTSWSDSAVTVYVQHTEGNKASTATTGTVSYTSDNEVTGTTSEVSGYTLNITDNEKLKNAKSIKFEYTNDLGFHDVETLLITSDGKNGDDSVIYQIICDPDTVNVNTEGEYSPTSIKLDLLEISGGTTTVLSQVPKDATLTYHTDTFTEETNIGPGTLEVLDLTGISGANVLTFNFVYGSYKTATSVRIARNTQGADGYPGCIYRRSVWELGKHYHNDTDVKPEGNTPRYIDAVFNTEAVGPEQIEDLRCWVCKQTHDSSETNDPKTGSEESKKVWEELSVKDPFYSPLILAKQISADMIDVASLTADDAFIKNLKVDTLKTNNISGETTIGYSYIHDNRIESFRNNNEPYFYVHDDGLTPMATGTTYKITMTEVGLWGGTGLKDEKYNVNLNELPDDELSRYDVYYDGRIIDDMNKSAIVAATINIEQSGNTVFIPGLEIHCYSYDVFKRDIDSTWGIIIPIFLRKKGHQQTRKLINYRTIGAGIAPTTIPGRYLFEAYEVGSATQDFFINDSILSNVEAGEWELCVGYGFRFYSRGVITKTGSSGKHPERVSITLKSWTGSVKVNYGAKGVEIGDGAFRVAKTTDGYFQTTGDKHNFKAGRNGITISGDKLNAIVSDNTVPLVPIVFAAKLTSTNGNPTTSISFSSIGKNATTRSQIVLREGRVAVIEGPEFRADDLVIATVDNVTDAASFNCIPIIATAKPSQNKLTVGLWDGNAAYPGFASGGTYNCSIIVIRS